MHDPHPIPPPFGHWMAAVPKGFLRYYVLKLLSVRPMSGSEIMSEIERRTGGRWRPSPGSVYPLLSRLQSKGYIVEVSGQEAGVKRYVLTDRGRAFLKGYIKRREEIRRRLVSFMYPFSELVLSEVHPENVRELFRARENFVMAFWDFLDSLREKYSEEAIAEAKKVIEEATRRISEIARKLKEDR